MSLNYSHILLLLIQLVPMLFTIVNRRLVALEGGLVNPLLSHKFLVEFNNLVYHITKHIKSACKGTKNGEYFVTLCPIINKC